MRNRKVTWEVLRAWPRGQAPRGAPGNPLPGAPSPPSFGGAGMCMEVYIYISIDRCSMFLVALTSTRQRIYILRPDIYICCAWGAAMGPSAGLSPLATAMDGALCILPPMQSPAHAGARKVAVEVARPSPRANWRVANVPTLTPPWSQGLSPLASLGEGALRVVPPVRKPRPGSPGKVAPPEPPRALAPRAAPPLQLPSPRRPERPTPPPRQLAPCAPHAGARSTTGGALAPGPGDRGPPAARGCVGTGVPGCPTARVTLPGPPP